MLKEYLQTETVNRKDAEIKASYCVIIFSILSLFGLMDFSKIISLNDPRSIALHIRDAGRKRKGGFIKLKLKKSFSKEEMKNKSAFKALPD